MNDWLYWSPNLYTILLISFGSINFLQVDIFLPLFNLTAE